MSEYAHPELLAEPDWLQANLDNPNVRVIDCATLEAYRRAHIPGAVQLPVHYYIKEEDPEARPRDARDASEAVRRTHGRLGVSTIPSS
ncbi:MAG: hypothetical protein IPN07_12210 [Dehalococcoidia bacterium]|nr:hypothetical protein [Dehalococcoidia bacterium]